MQSHGTPSQASEFPDWYVEFQASVIKSLPRPGDIQKDIALGWKDNRSALARSLKDLLVPPQSDRDCPPFTHWLERSQTGAIIGHVNLPHLKEKTLPDGVFLVPAKFQDLRSRPRFPTYPLIVDYNRNVEAWVEAGKYDRIDPSILRMSFPLSHTDKTRVLVQLVSFGTFIEVEDEDAVQRLDRMNLRPAELYELLALGEQYPRLQQENPIIALCSRLEVSDNMQLAPYLDGSTRERHLGLTRFGGRRSGSVRFAAVDKSA